jgi:hypothetical protein
MRLRKHVDEGVLWGLTSAQQKLLAKIATAINTSDIEFDGVPYAHRRIERWCSIAGISERTYSVAIKKLRDESLIKTLYKHNAKRERIAYHTYGKEFFQDGLPEGNSAESTSESTSESYTYTSNLINHNKSYPDASHQGGTRMKAKDFQEEILRKKKRTKGAFDYESLLQLETFTPGQADRLWKEMLSSVGRSSLPLKIGEQKLLAKYLSFPGFKIGLDRAVREWLKFCEFAKDEEGAFGMGSHPNINAVLKYRDSLLHFAERETVSPPVHAHGPGQQVSGVDCLPISDSPAAPKKSKAQQIWDEIQAKQKDKNDE